MASAGYEKKTLNAKISLFLLLVLGVFLIVAYASPYWSTTPEGYAGLWIACGGGPDCYERWNQWIVGWVRAVQVMLSLSLVCWTFSTFSLCLYLFFARFEEDRRLVFFSAINIFISGFFTVVCVIVWASGQHYGSGEILNWAYLMACFVALNSFLAFFFLIKELQYQRYMVVTTEFK